MRKLLPVVALTVLVPTAAWATVTEVQNTDDPIKHPYQQRATNTSCNSFAGDCALDFPAIATGLTLIQHVSCYFSLSTTSLPVYAVMGGASMGGDAGNYVPIVPYSTVTGVTSYGINADTYIFFGKTEKPVVDLNTSDLGPGVFTCTLSGYYL